MSRSSFTSASAFPAKLFGYVDKFVGGVKPVHVQLNISNACQLKCSFCSCRDRDRHIYMYDQLFTDYVDRLCNLGMEAVTITGGGEPLMHPQFKEFVEYLFAKGVKVGLVTNGIAVRNWPVALFKKMDWIRVSYDISRKGIPKLHDGVQWAFSYVYQNGAEKTKDFQTLFQMAKEGQLTHLRVVTDIHDDNASLPDITHPNVIMQNRSYHTRGCEGCWISLAKPVIDVAGLFFPCCGAQYAVPGEERNYNAKLCMGDLDSFVENHIVPQKPFDGRVCQKCYYSKYNEALDGIKQYPSLMHREFI